RIKTVKERLEKVKRQRGTQRKARERRGSFRVSLVGYTNAGKSTLFNALVKAKAYAADQLFATLDTTTRALWLASPEQTPGADDANPPNGDGNSNHGGLSVSLSDTVGFIRDLPHKLVEAFEATLHEAAEADLLLHVVDAASPLLAEQQAEVERVLEEIGAAGVSQLLVYNKCDLLEDSRQSREESDWIEAHSGVRRQRVFVSAQTGQGIDALRRAIADAAMQRLNAGVRPPPATLPDGSPVAASSSDTAPQKHA
ncbi:MAG TPA: GTPase HflX, partial [Rubrivivax sp.]|nr:GTPase HflX [Rubrivivax sp.]